MASYGNLVKVHVSKDNLNFSAAHFIAIKGFREKLHGHNYCVEVSITAPMRRGGSMIDIREIKTISQTICNELNGSFLVPMHSDVLTISFTSTNVRIVTEDLAMFSFPKVDCSLLPIVHTSAEELAIYISDRLVETFTPAALLKQGVQKMNVIISEADQQFAIYERIILPEIPKS
uniref:6-pyruvoyltetrahydropterin synthase n=1 Tax=Peronospora matthiolae TaxID=2874970 RepID=A0AAV1UIK9_9STRA